MKRIKNFVKIALICLCLTAPQTTQAMQNVLDYIQTYRKPVEKAVDYLLLAPRIIKTDIERGADPFETMALTLGFLQLFGPIGISKFATVNHKIMYFAIENNNINLVKSLLAHGYDINKAIKDAIWLNKPAFVKLFLEAGADAHADFDFYFAYFAPIDITPERRAKRLEIKRLINFYKAKQSLEPQIKEFLHKKAAAGVTQESLEEHLKSSGSTGGAHDITGIIKGYL